MAEKNEPKEGERNGPNWRFSHTDNKTARQSTRRMKQGRKQFI